MSAATTVNVASAAIPENKTKKVSPSLIAVYVVLVVLAVVWLLPVIYTVTTSFKSVAEFTSNAFNFLPAKWVLDNYMTLIEASASYPVLNWLGNSLIISTVFAVLSVCIVALAGFGYSRLNFKYRDTLFFVLLLISMFPAVVNMIPQYRIIASLGWVNTYWACIIPGLGNVANIFLVRNFMKGIPKELDEAAEIDGATDFQIFTRIMLPAIRPILIVIFLFSFTGAWNDFLWPTLVFNDINKMPVTAGLQLLSNQMGQYNQMGSLMAATCMAIIPTLLLFLFAQKYHSAMKYVGPVRKEIGIPTVFNILGPLTNPAHANVQLLGVYKPELLMPMAKALTKLGVKRGMAVYGTDKLDEISVSAPTKVVEFSDGNFEEYEITPEQFGMKRHDKSELAGGTPAENAEAARCILYGEKGAGRDAVLLNAGAALHILKGITIEDGIQLAADTIDSGAAMKTLEKYIKVSNEVKA